MDKVNFRTFGIFLCLLAMLALPSLLNAQGKLSKGIKKVERGEYNSAISFFEQSVKKGEMVAESNYWIGECYRMSNRVKEARGYYKLAYDDGLPFEDLPLSYAISMVAHEDYSGAKIVLEEFVGREANEENENYIMNAEDYLANLEYLEQIEGKKSVYRVKNMESINTEFAEYAPFYYKGNLFFTSNRGEGDIYKATGSYFTDLYSVKTKGAIVDLESLQKLGKEFNSIGVNDGCIAFSPSGKTVVFAKGNTGKKKGRADVSLYITYKKDGKWTEPRLMEINTPDSWNSTPAFSHDGKTLYFSSNRMGGYGGTDLYSATKDSRGRWTNVRNMGPKINTFGNEMFPTVSKYGKFYFSSDGHPSFGGLDLFSAQRQNGTIVVRNLGKPINSAADDFALFMYSRGKGFFSSNREDGKGDDDIYTFVNTDPKKKIVNYYLAGISYTLDDEGNEVVLPNTSVKLLTTNEDVLGETVTDEEGNFKFRVYEGEVYNLFGAKDGYLTGRNTFSMIGKELPEEKMVKQINEVVYETKVVLNKLELNKAIVLENIYYDFDKANIREDAALELDKLVNILVDNPKIKIELSSHTDSKGEALYNQDLSQRRAESAVAYIISKGIEPVRLQAKGYGESAPIAPNTMPDGSDNPEGRQKNRRTEFKVTDIMDKQPSEGIKEENLEELFFGSGD